MIYKNYFDVVKEVKQWDIPSVDAVAGVSPGGIMIAAVLALHRGLPLVALDSLPADKQVLICNDRDEFPDVPGIKVACLADVFEWNLWQQEGIVTELDGVLCPAWTAKKEEGEAYIKHLENAPCLIKPCKVLGIVSARLKIYQTQTEAWLKKNNIEYDFLVLSPYGSVAERVAYDGNAGHKAKVFIQIGDMLIEPNTYHAEQIAGKTNKPVLDWSIEHKANFIESRRYNVIEPNAYCVEEIVGKNPVIKPVNILIEPDAYCAEQIATRTNKPVLDWSTKQLRYIPEAKHFSSGGDVGDTLSQLTSVRQMGGGKLHLVPKPGVVREPYTEDKVELLKPLIERCPYITSVEYSPVVQGTDLDKWRYKPRNYMNLSDQVSSTFSLPHYPRNEPWLYCDDPNPVAPVVCSRSPRWHGCEHLWRRIILSYRAADRVFVGLESEWKEFRKKFGPISYYKTIDYWELARVLAGAKICCHNQSCPLWISLGLCLPDKKLVVEVCRASNNCHWQRSNILYCRDHGACNCELPCL